MKGLVTYRFAGYPEEKISHAPETSSPLKRRRPHVIATCFYPGCNLTYSENDPMASLVVVDGYQLHFCWQHTTSNEEPKLFCACGECDRPLVERKPDVFPWTLSKDAVCVDGQVWSRECLSEKLVANQRLNEAMPMELAYS